MKQITCIFSFFVMLSVYGQMGVNTQDPKGTLDIVAKKGNSADGLLVPRLTADEVKAMDNKVGTDQNSLLVYVTKTSATALTGKCANINSEGYYYYDHKNGQVWKKLIPSVSSANYTEGAGIEIGSGVISATGLERIAKVRPSTLSSTYFPSSYYAWRLIGRNEARYLDPDYGAIDLSFNNNNTSNPKTGASGDFSVAMGLSTTASGGVSTAMGYSTTAIGSYSTAMGYNTTSSGSHSTAMGIGTRASGGASTAMGESTTASGRTSTAMGRGTTASGEYSTAMGFRTTASGEYSTAIGYGTEASGEYSTAMGEGTEANGSHSTAMGEGTTAIGNYSIAMGFRTTASGYISTAMGYQTTAIGVYSTAMGYSTTASGDRSTAMGEGTTASGQASTAMGEYTTASGDFSTAMGMYNVDITDALLMVGNGTSGNRKNALTVYKNGDIEAKKIYDTSGGSSDKVVTVDTSGKLKSVAKSSLAGSNYTAGKGIEISSNKISATGLERLDKVRPSSLSSTYFPNSYYAWRLIGRNETRYLPPGYAAVDLSFNDNDTRDPKTGASGDFSVAMGNGTTASGTTSIAMGKETKALGENSTAMGEGTTAIGYVSTAMGYLTTARGYYSTAMGLGTTASGGSSTAMGVGTTASGKYSIAMGQGTIAIGANSTAMGRGTDASGEASTAMGRGTTASGEASTAMGRGTTASGYDSTAMGNSTTASGDWSTAMGWATTASGRYSTAMGERTTARANHCLAIGYENTGYTNTYFEIGKGGSNAFTVYYNGNASLAGRLSQNSDRRLKKDIETLPKKASSLLAQLRPVQYRWNSVNGANADTKTLQYGFIAQEVLPLFPNLVQKDEITSYYSMNYTGLIPVLTKALQEKSAEIEELKAKLAQQQQQYKNLEARIRALEK